MAKAIVVALLLSMAAAAVAKEATPAAADPVLEARVMAVSGELRCLVCQNQSIAESDSDLAKDLRAQIREKLDAGQSEREIVEYMIARYGDFVLWRPPFKSTTVLLWLGPPFLLAIALLALARRLARARAAGEIEISESARTRAARLLQPRLEREEP